MRPLDRPFTMGQLLTLQSDTVTVLIYGKRYDIPVSVSEHQLLTTIAQDEIVLLPINFERTRLLLDIPELSPQLERELNEFADSDESVTALLKEGV
ncbi:hypothetical protein ACNOIU_15590 (plasmid) [Exiguobacterium mexicanum]|uniref:Uncharacterized protein n=1 Tax=Exiguobacterium mexicanum TaxID=340146 RepID=A0ABT7MSA6_9BACL|nr:MULTISPECIES: hypothetical protein [Exiguobacterium]MCM3281701.1 hypothetical protein [Exiguobacterium sp. MER 193]MDL5378093.1 hypothetical protein [Exiguobacterium mexicanum]TCI68006.1 hypothetical protein EVJ19_12055 [Exiguobacterium sp. IPCI3]TCI77423.1 hypothetical protein EVJ18_12045 [Exiguobacterium sp. IPCH1]TCI78901.1 hypothetical protein EVJ17_12045 [Exiguobacterium sp. IPBC4]